MFCLSLYIWFKTRFMSKILLLVFVKFIYQMVFYQQWKTRKLLEISHLFKLNRRRTRSFNGVLLQVMCLHAHEWSFKIMHWADCHTCKFCCCVFKIRVIWNQEYHLKCLPVKRQLTYFSELVPLSIKPRLQITASF